MSGYNVYSGQLARLANTAQERVLPAPSPRHAADESDNDLSKAQRTLPAGTGNEYGGTQFEPNLMPGGGMELDTPVSWAGDVEAEASRIKYARVNPHDSRAVLTLRQADEPNGGRLSAHDGSLDRGWKRTTFSGEPLADDRQQREADRTDGYSNPFGAASEPDMVKYVRGRSSRPEDNPDGFRLGNLWRWSWDPQRTRHVTRDYGIQYTQPRDYYTAPSRQVMVKSMVTGTALPRSAGSFDDAVMSGNDTSNVQSASSSFGGF
jgi:hypothetical protein